MPRNRRPANGFTGEATEACGACRGPFEFWGLSAEFRLLRCLTCRVVRYVERSEGLGTRRLSSPAPDAAPDAAA